MNKLWKKFESFKMTPEERKKLRERLFEFMEKNPVRADDDMRLNSWRRILSLSFVREVKFMPVLIVALVIALSGGTVIASENSLPGDALYPVKVGFNERVRGAFAFSSEAKADLFIDLAERRLTEAERLAVSGRFSAEHQAHLEERFQSRVEMAQQRIDELRAERRLDEAARLSSNLEAALQVHEEILTRLEAGEVPIGSMPIGHILNRVRVHSSSSAELRESINSQISAEGSLRPQEAAEGMRTAARNKIEMLENLIAQTEGRVSAEASAQAALKLQQAESLMAEGEAQLEAGAFAEAFGSFRSAHQTAQEAVLVVNLDRRFKLNSELETNLETDSEAEIESETDSNIDVDAEVEAETNLNLQIGN